MTQPTGIIKKEKPPVRFWPYAFFGSFLLVVFVTAIVTPDYFNYQIRLAKIEASVRIATNNVAATVATNMVKGVTDVGHSKTSDKAIDESLIPASQEIKASEIFETYGKLLTMLLGFVSVLGVFFGYFVRKSLREVEEDLREHVQLSMNLWEKEKDRLTKEVDGKLKEICAGQETNKKLVEEFQGLMDRGKKALDALEAAAKAEEQKSTVTAARTATAAAMIDADKSIPDLPEK